MVNKLTLTHKEILPATVSQNYHLELVETKLELKAKPLLEVHSSGEQKYNLK